MDDRNTIDANLVPPDGYEIVDRENESDDARVCDDWIFYIHDQHRWCPSRSIGEFLYLLPPETIYARPIRKRKLWVKAGERQPPVDKRVPIKSEVAGFLGYATVDPSGDWYQNGRLRINDSLGCKLWLDLDAVDEIEAERDRLAAEVAILQQNNHAALLAMSETKAENADLRARIAGLERELDAALMAVSPAKSAPEVDCSTLKAENNLLRFERDALEAALVGKPIEIRHLGDRLRGR